MSYLKLINSEFNINIDFKEKFYLVDGYSGCGKSAFVSYVESELLLNNSLDTDLKIFVVTSKDSFNYAVEHANDEGSLIIADENLVSALLQHVINKKCYCLFITRKIYSNINMSYRSLLVAERSMDGITQFKQKYKFTDTVESEEMLGVIITEDSGYGKTFLEGMNICNIVSSNGKGNISKTLKEESKNYRSILCIFDAGGIASHIKTIYERVRSLKSSNIDVKFLVPECFEQVLLCSKYYKYDIDIYKYFRPEYNNTESFCEKEIQKISRGTKLECIHDKGVLSECWYKDCKECSEKDCCYRVDDKYKHVLSDGPFECLLKYKMG